MSIAFTVLGAVILLLVFRFASGPKVAAFWAIVGAFCIASDLPVVTRIVTGPLAWISTQGGDVLRSVFSGIGGAG